MCSALAQNGFLAKGESQTGRSPFPTWSWGCPLLPVPTKYSTRSTQPRHGCKLQALTSRQLNTMAILQSNTFQARDRH